MMQLMTLDGDVVDGSCEDGWKDEKGCGLLKT